MARTTSKIRILYTIPNFDTAGSGKALLKIAQRLNPEKFEPHIACFHDRGSFFQVVKNSGIPIHLVKYTSPMIPRLKGLKNCWKIAKKLKKIQPSIIHSFHYAPDYSEVLSSRLVNIPWVYTKKNMNWGGNSKNGWYLRSYLANGIVVQNTDMVKEFFPNSKRVKLIPRGVDTTEFLPQPTDKALLSELHLSEFDFIILCVANLVPVKGVENLIHATGAVQTKHPEVRLLIVGDNENEYGRTLQRIVEENQWNEIIRFTGKRMDIKRFHSIAQLFVLPTLNKGRKEGSPVSLLEAMACAVPVLGSNIPGIRDQLAPLPARLVSPENITQLTEKIIKEVKKTNEQRSFEGQTGLNRVLEAYTIEKEVIAHEDFYSSILSL